MTIPRHRLKHAVTSLACELVAGKDRAADLESTLEDVESKAFELELEVDNLRGQLASLTKTALLVATKHGCRKAMQVAIDSKRKGTK